MKRIFYTVVALYLLFQSMIGVLSILSMPENTVILLALSGLSGWGAYWFGQKARAISIATENAPTGELDVPETQPLDRK